MEFGGLVTSLFVIFEAFFYLVTGQTVNIEKSDCTKFSNFLYGDSRDYSNTCCSDPGIVCDNDGYIKAISNLNELVIIKDNDFMSFPYFSRIEELEIKRSGLKEIPKNILNSATLKKLILAENNIEVIPSDIQNLSQLEELILTNNNIKKLPNEIFNLTHLKKLDLENNQNLQTKMINFGNSTIEECNFGNINISCYQPNTCDLINFKNKLFKDSEAEEEFKLCSEKEIKKVLDNKENKINISQEDKNLSEDDNNNINQKISPFIFIGGIICIGVIIGVFVSYVVKKRSRIQKNNKFEISSNDGPSTEKNEAILDKKQKEDNNEKTPNKLEREFLFQNILND